MNITSLSIQGSERQTISTGDQFFAGYPAHGTIACILGEPDAISLISSHGDCRSVSPAFVIPGSIVTG